MAFHPMGTARAGAPGLSACDPWGRLHGHQGLAVADGSLFPTSNKINPQLTIMALVRRAARKWAKTW
jgi:choline dehydrogenase-like flavoprotein